MAKVRRKSSRSAPEGFTVLPAGVTRKLRVNRDWISDGDGKPFLVVEGRQQTQYAEVHVAGPCRFESVAGGLDTYGCRTAGSAWVETEAEVWVRA